MKGRALFAMVLAGTISAFGATTITSAVWAQEKTETVAVKVPAGTYQLDPTHAILLWSYRHNTISNYTGRFDKISATLKLNPADISRSSISFTADPASVDVAYPADYKGTHPNSAYASWKEELARDPQFLNSDNFPKITFTSTKVEQTSPTTAKVTGDLTFLGVTKPLTLDATFEGAIESHPFMKVPAVGFSAVGTFKRTDFGQEVGFVGNEVTIRFDGEFIQQLASK
ncbi:MAG: YceI family protein [Xanthobacter sp.]